MNTSSTVTLVIAIVGAFTCILSLIINYVSYKKTKANLSISLSEHEHSFFISLDSEATIDGYSTDCFAIISLEPVYNLWNLI